jgi:hypothetical protein
LPRFTISELEREKGGKEKILPISPLPKTKLWVRIELYMW